MAINQIQLLAKQQRAEVLAADAAKLEEIARAYAAMYDRLQGDVEALTAKIETMDAPTAAEIKRLPQYKRLLRRGAEELDKFTTYLEITIGAAALAAVGLGLSHSGQLISAATGKAFTGLEAGVMSKLLDYLKQDGPLYKRLAEITNGTVDKVVQSILDGVGSGYNPQKIARGIQDAFGGGLTDALRNTRTVQLYSYRDSARANYMASGVVDGWVWFAEMDGDQCESCTVENGQIHALDEEMDSHYNCRCSCVPYIEGLTPDVASGESWYNGLTDEQQRDYLGASKYEALQSGKFTFSQMSRDVPNDVYGSMKGVTPLKDLIGE